MANKGSESKLHVEIVSPTGLVFDDYCHMVTIPGVDGDYGIMNNHEIILTRLKEGKINIYNNSEKLIKDFTITGGFAHNVEDKVIILLDK
jgi:F-type H+-transporting ATPase subunit epsilon